MWCGREKRVSFVIQLTDSINMPGTQTHIPTSLHMHAYTHFWAHKACTETHTDKHRELSDHSAKRQYRVETKHLKRYPWQPNCWFLLVSQNTVGQIQSHCIHCVCVIFLQRRVTLARPYFLKRLFILKVRIWISWSSGLKRSDSVHADCCMLQYVLLVSLSSSICCHSQWETTSGKPSLHAAQ